jgi:DNA-binding response OmpR family regulator
MTATTAPTAVAGLEVLVVEDAPEFVQIVTGVLRERGHRVRSAGSIADAVASMASVPPDLVVLDLSLPDGDGLDLCRTIRERSSAYILMLTGRDDEIDKIVGFKLGADDYVTKPFSPRELAVRVDALARRPRAASQAVSEMSVGEVVIRPASREVLVRGVDMELTRIEFDLLALFAGAPQQVFTRQQVLDQVWGENWYGDRHVIDVHIANLRRKLADHTDQNIIRTVRGVGYGLAAPAAAA